ncbi:methyltransferase family protein [Parasphingorhabdus sp. NYA22]
MAQNFTVTVFAPAVLSAQSLQPRVCLSGGFAILSRLMMKFFRPEEDSAQVRFPPPLVYVGFLLTGLLLDRLSDRVPDFIPVSPLIMAAGGIALLSGIFVMLAGTSRFRKLGNNLEPWKHSNQIVSTGVYRYTRNPMYLGMALFYLGLALWFRSSWAVILLPVALIVIRTQVIAREERYLAAKFGDEYLAYKAKVRRWF